MASVASLTSYDYAAGTWALRLTGQVSPLSALTERVVLKRLRFQLRLWEESDNSGHDQTHDGRWASSNRAAPAFEVSGHGADLADLSHLVQTYVQQFLQEQSLTPSQGLSRGQSHLAPVGLTRHRLTITGPSPPAAVNLSLVQLADLATLLGQAEQSVEHLPEELAPAQPQRRSRSFPRLPLWAGSVAAVLVAAVLGSQWLGQMPLSVVQSPAPTSEAPTEGIAPGESTAEQAAPLDNDTALAPSTTPPAETPEPQTSQAAQPAPGGMGAPTSRNNPAPAPGDSAVPPDVSPGVGPAQPPPRRGTPPASPRPQPLPDSLLAAPPPATPQPSAESLPSTVFPSAPETIPEQRGARTGAPEAASSATSNAPPESPETPAPEAFATGLADSGPGNDLGPLRVALVEGWRPIAGLASPLRYRITLGATGEILAIEPLTAPARQYLAQNRLPQVGTVLPDLRLAEPTTVEVELLPSGDVNIYPNPAP